MDLSGLAPRRAALILLGKVLHEGRLLSELGETLAPLAPEDRARAQRLASETLRGMDRADRWMRSYLSKRPPAAVQNILRLGAVEIGQGAAPHGVVDACVDLAGDDRRTQSFKGLVNAVLRKLGADGAEMWERLPVPVLPRWLRQPLVTAWGQRAVQRIEAAHFAGAPLDLTPKCAAESADIASALGGDVLPTGSVRVVRAGQISLLPGYDGGRWWVQDAAAALPVQLMAPKPGQRILDMCAAPGGKTLQLAAAGAEVVALDLSENRMLRLRENLERTGLSARCEIGDALQFEEGGFDAVLLDAPCSATGTIRRHPDLPWAKDGAEFATLIEQQERMIDHGLDLLRPGGRMIFCTCSLLPDEGEVQVEAALERHQGLRVDGEARARPGVEQDWHSAEGGLRLRPDQWADRGGLDGFYLAALVKPS